MEPNKLRYLKSRVARNISGRRAVRGWTQDELAKRAGIARTNISYLESGEGNPSLEVLAQIADAFQISLEELMSAPLREFRVHRASELMQQKRNAGKLIQLIPDEIKGFEVDKIELSPNGWMAGAPHMKGTREYFFCLKGKIAVSTENENHSLLEEGDLVIFSGDQKHTYVNYLKQKSEGLSIIILPSQWSRSE